MYALETLAVHAGEEPDLAAGALTPPIHTSAAYAALKRLPHGSRGRAGKP